MESSTFKKHQLQAWPYDHWMFTLSKPLLERDSKIYSLTYLSYILGKNKHYHCRWYAELAINTANSRTRSSCLLANIKKKKENKKRQGRTKVSANYKPGYWMN